MLTGEIWRFDLGDPVDPEAGFDHFGLIVSPPKFISPLRIVCPITSMRRAYPWRIEVEPDAGNGLKQVSYVQAEHVRGIAARRGDYQLGVLDPVLFVKVQRVLRMLLDL